MFLINSIYDDFQNFIKFKTDFDFSEIIWDENTTIEFVIYF